LINDPYSGRENEMDEALMIQRHCSEVYDQLDHPHEKQDDKFHEICYGIMKHRAGVSGKTTILDQIMLA
jgi:hypothetical protein